MWANAVLHKNDQTLARDFDAFFREHYQLVYQAAYGVTGNRDDAEDTLQDLFVKLLEQGFQPNLMKNPKGYLHRAAVNQALAGVRSRRHENAVPDEIRDVPEDELAGVPMDEDIRERLLDAIAHLKPPAVVDMLVLVYVQGYSIAEVANIVGKSQTAVAVSLFRARIRLKKLMCAGIKSEE